MINLICSHSLQQIYISNFLYIYKRTLVISGCKAEVAKNNYIFFVTYSVLLGANLHSSLPENTTQWHYFFFTKELHRKCSTGF